MESACRCYCKKKKTAKRVFFNATKARLRIQSVFTLLPFSPFYYMPAKCFTIVYLSIQLSSALERAQRRAMRIIYGQDVSYTEALKTANIDSLSQRRSGLSKFFSNKPSLILTICYFIYYHLTLIILRRVTRRKPRFLQRSCVRLKSSAIPSLTLAQGFMTPNKPSLFI